MLRASGPKKRFHLFGYKNEIHGNRWYVWKENVSYLFQSVDGKVKFILTAPWPQVHVPVLLYPPEKPDDTKSTT